MKRKLLPLLFAILLVFSICMLTACDLSGITGTPQGPADNKEEPKDPDDNNATTEHEHKLVNHKAVPPSCIVEGNIEYWSCSICGKYFIDANGVNETTQISINKTDHLYDSDDCCIICKHDKYTKGLSYSISSDGTYYSVTGIGSAKVKDIAIPPTYQGLPVVRIGYEAFKDCSSLTSITIPDSVTSIGTLAFDDCSSLNAVYISDIAKWCAIYFSDSHSNPLYYAKNLYLNGELVTDLVIPNGVTSIGSSAFYNCSSLTSITIPDSVTSIGEDAFCRCSSLTSVTISDSITSIGDLAFWGCSSLTSVTIGNDVTSIGRSAFEYCYKLVEVYNKSSLTITKGSNNNGNVAYYALDVYTDTSIPSKVDHRDDGYIFYIDGDTVYLLGYSGNDTELTLPENYNSKNYEIYKYAFYERSSLTSVTIGNGVTSIGDYAFSGCSSLTSVTIGESVTSIGWYAFLDCTSLTSVTIGNGVTSIGHSAFLDCTSLNAVHITDIAKWCAIDFSHFVSDNPLYYAKNLYLNGKLVTDLVIPDGVTSICDHAFRYCSSLTSVTIPDSVTSIGEDAFYNCGGLTSVTIGNGVTSIGYHAFEDCSSLNAVYITDIAKWCAIVFGSNPLSYAKNLYLNGVEIQGNFVMPDGVTKIPSYTFKNCTNLISVTIPDSVTSIGDYAFEDCSSLTSVTIGNGVTIIGEWAFNYCSSLTSVTIGNSVTSIGDYAFRYCSSLSAVYITDIAKWCAIDFGDYVANPLCYAKNLYLNGELITDLVIPDGVTSIGERAFEDCSSLTSVTIPDGVTSIGGMAFSYCYKLVEVYNKSSLTITKGSKDNGNVAYYALDVYTDTSIPSKVDHRDDGYIFYADGDTVYLLGYIGNDTELTLPENYNGKNYAIYQYAFYERSSLTSVTIGNGVTSIGYNAFYNSSSLTSITIGNGVTSIGDGAFWCCYKLVEVYNKSSLTITKGSYDNGYVGRYALNVYKDTSIPSKVHHRDDGYIFYVDGDTVYLLGYNGNDTELILPENYNGKNYEINKYAFYKCTSLTSVTIGNGVTSIGNNAFNGCSDLIEIIDGVQYVDTWVIGCDTSVTTVTIRKGTKGIAYRAFHNCENLTSVTIPDSVTSIGKEAFRDCSSLNAVYITDIAKWCAIDFGNYTDNPLYYAKNLYLNGELIEGDLVIPDGATSIGIGAFYYCSGLTSITIPNSVTSIGNYAFYNCSSLTSITIPDSVTSIGKYAFEGCSSLTSITIPNSVTSIGWSAFYNCSSLNAVYITDIAKWCAIDFGDYYANPLVYAKNLYLNGELVTDLVIPDGVTSIDDFAFSGCSSLTSITIPDSVTSIGDRAFFRCSSLTSVTIPDSVTSIGVYAFYGCDSLTSVTIPDSVTNIGDYAFAYCSSLTSVTIPNSVTRIGEYAFRDCSSLTDVYFTGTEEEWNEISISSSGNSYLTNATIHFNYVPED